MLKITAAVFFDRFFFCGVCGRARRYLDWFDLHMCVHGFYFLFCCVEVSSVVSCLLCCVALCCDPLCCVCFVALHCVI